MIRLRASSAILEALALTIWLLIGVLVVVAWDVFTLGAFALENGAVVTAICRQRIGFRALHFGRWRRLDGWRWLRFGRWSGRAGLCGFGGCRFRLQEAIDGRTMRANHAALRVDAIAREAASLLDGYDVPEAAQLLRVARHAIERLARVQALAGRAYTIVFPSLQALLHAGDSGLELFLWGLLLVGALLVGVHCW